MKKAYEIRNSYFFHDWYARLKMIAVSAFKWDGLPDTCNERFLEDTLFHFGKAVFVDDKSMGFLSLKVTPSDMINVYNEHLGYTAYGVGYNKFFKAKDCVLIRNNPLEKSTESTILTYAERLAEIDRTIEINIKAQKTPLLIRCDDKTKSSLEAVYNQYNGNKPVIFGVKSLGDKPVEVLSTGAPFVANLLREEKRAIWNEVLEYLGFNTNPSDKKKERLVTIEVESNNEQIDIQCLTMLASRRKACEEINKKYGLNVSVSLRVDDFKEEYDFVDEKEEMVNG